MIAVIEKRIQETSNVIRWKLTVPSVEVFHFQAGQFVILTIPGLPEHDNQRSYSIASAPSSDNTFEICMVLNPKGSATPILWNMKESAAIEITEAQGSFILPSELNKELIFICTGTGIAPFVSMVKHALRSLHNNQPVYLVAGFRYENDILYKKDLELLASEYSNFNFIPVLSREENWKGAKGYVHSVYEKLFADGRDAFFFVCGWKEMCKEARHRLKNLGYNRKQYFFELYD